MTLFVICYFVQYQMIKNVRTVRYPVALTASGTILALSSSERSLTIRLHVFCTGYSVTFEISNYFIHINETKC